MCAVCAVDECNGSTNNRSVLFRRSHIASTSSIYTAQTSAQRRKLLDFLKCQGKSRKKIFWHLLDPKQESFSLN